MTTLSDQDLFSLFEEPSEKPASNPHSTIGSSTPTAVSSTPGSASSASGSAPGNGSYGNGSPTPKSTNGTATPANGNGSSYGHSPGNGNGQTATGTNAAIQSVLSVIQAVRQEIEQTQAGIKAELGKVDTLGNPAIEAKLSQLNRLPVILDKVSEVVQQQFQGKLPAIAQQQFTANREWLGGIAQLMQQVETQDDLFRMVVSELRDRLQADRVVILEFGTANKLTTLAESIAAGWTPMQGETFPAVLFGAENAREYQRKQVVTLRQQDQDRVFAYQRQLLERYQVLASVAIPLISNDRVQGLLVLQQCGQPRNWQEQEIYLLTDIVSKVTLALQFIQFKTQLKQIAAREQATAKVIYKIRSTVDIQAIFRVTTQEVSRLFNVERVTIYKFRSDYFGDFVEETIMGNYPRLVGSGWEDPYLHEHKGGRFRNNEPLIVDDVHVGETLWTGGRMHADAPRKPLTDCHVEALEYYQVKACAVVAIFHGNKLWGLLSAFQNTGARRWEEAEIQLLTQVANQLGIALQQAEFVEQVESKEVQLEKLMARERASDRVIEKIRSTLDVQAIFRVTTQEISRLLGVERVTIYKFRPDFFGDFVEETVSGNYPRLVGSGWEDPYIHEHKGGRFRTNEPLVVDDIHVGETLWTDGRMHAQAPRKPLTDCHVEALEFYQVEACAVVSIFHGNKLWGLLSAFQNTGARQWEEAEIHLLMKIANQLGIALKQAEFVEGMETKTLELEQVVDREQALARVVNRIRNTLDVEAIFKAATQEVRSLLNIERFTIYQFRPDFFGDFIAESVTGDYPSLVGSGWEDTYLHEHQGGRFRQNLPFVADDIHLGETLWQGGQLNRQAPRKPLTDCHVEALEFYKVKAFAVVAIFQGTKLWGLLSAFHNSTTRQWEDGEVTLLLQVATQVGIALQQAEYANQLKTQAQQLAEALAREQALARVVNRIRNTLDIDTIFKAATQEVRSLLNIERFTIYQFRPDFFGDFIAESVTGDYPSLVGSGWEDTYLHEHQGGRFRQNLPFVADDIHLGETLWQGGQLNRQAPRKPLTDCHVEALEFYKVKAFVVVAIFQGTKLWGLLSAFHNSTTRQWEDGEVNLLLQVAAQVGIALQQADYVKQLQIKAQQLAESIEREQALARVVNRIRITLDVDAIFKTATQEVRSLLNIERVTIYQFRPDFFGDFIAESVTGGYPSLSGSGWEDPYVSEHQGGRFRQNLPLVVDDIHRGEILWEGGHLQRQLAPKPMTDCHVEALEFYQVKACAVVSIFQGTKLWGLLSAFQNSAPRQWEDGEVNLLLQVAAQVGIALQQAEYAKQLEIKAQQLREAADREKASKELLQKRAVQLLMAVRPALDGDLTVRAPITEDEVGTIADAYNNTLQALRKIVLQVKEAAVRVSATSQSSSSQVDKLAQGAQQESQQMTAALAQIQAMVDGTRAVASSAQQVEVAIQQANQIVRQGDAAMNRTVDGISGIRETVSETSKKIKRLSESSQKISKVVNLISTFTAQTQLLALNAAIEATRAGEAGRGFAVVADEVRSLARQSAEATIEIQNLVQEIQVETSGVVTAMDAGIDQVVSGTTLVNATRQSLNEIVAATAQISDLVQSIAQATQSQTQQTAVVTQTMTTVVAIAQQTSTEATQISASFQDLRTTADELQASVGRFKVS